MSRINNSPEAQPLWLIGANDLLLGDVVYYADDNSWCRQLSQALHLEDREAAMIILTHAQCQTSIVDPSLIAATRDAGGSLNLTHFRDRFRENGPSHRDDLSRRSTNGTTTLRT